MGKEKLWFDLILFLRFHSCFYSMLLLRAEIHFCLYILQKEKLYLSILIPTLNLYPT